MDEYQEFGNSKFRHSIIGFQCCSEEWIKRNQRLKTNWLEHSRIVLRLEKSISFPQRHTGCYLAI